MHRHGYKGSKLGRKRDQRKALMRSLSIELFEHGSITTTLPKAKALRPVAEKLISRAKVGDLHSRRLLISRLGNNISIANKLVDEVAPKIKRDSGYLRIEKQGTRRGDFTEMATISFVDDIMATTPEKKPAKKPAAKKTETKKPAAKTTDKEDTK